MKHYLPVSGGITCHQKACNATRSVARKRKFKLPCYPKIPFLCEIPLQAIWNDVIVRLCSGAAASQCFVRCQWLPIATSIAPGKFKRGGVSGGREAPRSQTRYLIKHGTSVAQVIGWRLPPRVQDVVWNLQTGHSRLLPRNYGRRYPAS